MKRPNRHFKHAKNRQKKEVLDLKYIGRKECREKAFKSRKKRQIRDAFASFPVFCFVLVVFNMPYRSQAVWDGGLR
jgi:hypothetical protein